MKLKLLQLTVDLCLSFLMELWATRTQLKVQRHTIIVMMGLPRRERWQQYADQMGDGVFLQSAGHLQVVWQYAVLQSKRAKLLKFIVKPFYRCIYTINDIKTTFPVNSQFCGYTILKTVRMTVYTAISQIQWTTDLVKFCKLPSHHIFW